MVQFSNESGSCWGKGFTALGARGVRGGLVWCWSGMVLRGSVVAAFIFAAFLPSTAQGDEQVPMPPASANEGSVRRNAATRVQADLGERRASKRAPFAPWPALHLPRLVPFVASPGKTRRGLERLDEHACLRPHASLRGSRYASRRRSDGTSRSAWEPARWAGGTPCGASSRRRGAFAWARKPP